jgi:carbon starvation protein
MSLAAIVLACLALFALAFRVYARVLARLFALDPAARTPAHAQQDGQDFVPTPRFYLLSQHFSAISAAGPIVGPILAATMFGWAPALLWIVFGCILIGALHDFAALVGSVRHRGCSVAEILRRWLNPRTYLAFVGFIWLALVLVIVAFTDVTARAFLDDLTIAAGPGAPAVTISGPGVAGSSTLYLLIALVMGVALRATRLPLWLATLVFVPLVGAAIWFGPSVPIALRGSAELPTLPWALAILLYCGVASVLPVWLLLQPRGYLGGFFLYVTLVGGLLGLLAGGHEVRYDAWKGFTAANGDPLVPFLFITIACGACSGFHGLVCSGTTSKQLDREPDARVVGYGGMLLEGVVALIALACVIVLVPGTPVTGANADKVFGQGVGRFLHSLGVPLQFAVTFGMLAFATFVYDTLDVCTRLARYLFSELLGRRTPGVAVAGTLVSLVVPLVLVTQVVHDAGGRLVPAYRYVWPLFGATNQLLAGLTLLGLVLWLWRTGKPVVLRWLVAVPMAFMLAMTTSALVLQVTAPKATVVLQGFGVLLLALSAWIVVEALLEVLRGRRGTARPALG